MHPRGVKHLQFPKKYYLNQNDLYIYIYIYIYIYLYRVRIIKLLQILSPSDNNEFLLDLDSSRGFRMTSRDFAERARHVKTRELTILRHYLRTRVVTESEVVTHFVSNRNIRTNDAAHTPLQKKKNNNNDALDPSQKI